MAVMTRDTLPPSA